MSFKSTLTEDEEEYVILALQEERELLFSEVNAAKLIEDDAARAYDERKRRRVYLQEKLIAVDKFLAENVEK